MECNCACHDDDMDLRLLCNCCLIGGGVFGNMGGSVQCLECGKILISRTRHDFVGCGCPNKTFVDGGYSYLRTGGNDLDKIKLLKAYECGELVDNDKYNL